LPFLDTYFMALIGKNGLHASVTRHTATLLVVSTDVDRKGDISVRELLRGAIAYALSYRISYIRASKNAADSRMFHLC
jgi:hypothetical protein